MVAGLISPPFFYLLAMNLTLEELRDMFQLSFDETDELEAFLYKNPDLVPERSPGRFSGRHAYLAAKVIVRRTRGHGVVPTPPPGVLSFTRSS